MTTPFFSSERARDHKLVLCPAPWRARLITNMYMFLISCVFNLLACMYMYIRLSIVENESSSILQANYQPVKRNYRSTSMVF